MQIFSTVVSQLVIICLLCWRLDSISRKLKSSKPCKKRFENFAAVFEFRNKSKLMIFSKRKLAHLCFSTFPTFIPRRLRASKSHCSFATGIRRPWILTRATIWLMSITHNTSTAAGLTCARPSTGNPSFWSITAPIAGWDQFENAR